MEAAVWAGFEPRAWDLQPFPFRSEIKDSSETQRNQNKPIQQNNQTLGSQRPGGLCGHCFLPHMSCKTLQDVTHFVFHVEMIPEMQLGPPPSFAGGCESWPLCRRTPPPRPVLRSLHRSAGLESGELEKWALVHMCYLWCLPKEGGQLRTLDYVKCAYTPLPEARTREVLKNSLKKFCQLSTWKKCICIKL